MTNRTLDLPPTQIMVYPSPKLSSGTGYSSVIASAEDVITCPSYVEGFSTHRWLACCKVFLHSLVLF